MSRIPGGVTSLIGDRERWRDTALAALVPLAACSVALAGLTTWTGAGKAGTPARVRVTDGRVLLPSAGVPETAAFFRLVNEGGSTDRLTGVTSPRAPGGITLTRHRMNENNGASRSTTDSVAVPAGGTLAMTPSGVDLTVPTSPGSSGSGSPGSSERWREGDLVPFTFEFRHTGPVEVLAVVQRPGTVSFP
ncbi:copper chaperone PCu(A)C [Streptomyces apricus]|uniref:Copper chaperone PCu(A)C n=1 Tax=Streptomyces apricus TaxID=1828112 RepID=A0A5A9ZWI4_9ACTN|nr:copper chaperone PCu(A)C [Streptomyces apricus]KAA0921550.1 copper chaperone PCu(A)C [Streptomyces apricus]